MKKLSLKSAPSTSKASGFGWLTTAYPWLLFLAVLALTWLLAQLFWLVLAPPTAPNLAPLPLQPTASPQTMTANALDIFAQSQAVQAPVAPPPDVKVLGVTVAVPAQLSYAIINAYGKTQSYRINDVIEGSAYKLVGVKRDFILLADSSGQTTKIQFGQPFLLDQSEAIRAKTNANANVGMNNGTMGNVATAPSVSNAPIAGSNFAPTVNIPNGMASEPPDNRGDNGDGSNNSNNDTGAKNAIGSAVTGLQQNPASYLSQMGVSATGQGYLVTDSMPAGLKNRLGLQTGDKVLSVNGQTVGQNPAQDAQLLQQVQQSGQAQIQVQRGDQTVTVRQSF